MEAHFPSKLRGLIALAWLPALAGLATLLNGSVFWARRVGLLEPDRYWVPYTQLTTSDAARSGSYEIWLEALHFGAAMHQVEGPLWLAKLAKDAVWIAVLVVLVRNIRGIRLPPPMSATYLAFAGLALNATIQALTSGAWLDIVAGGRAGLAWLLAAAGASLATRALCRVVARTCVALLLCQVPLIVAELINGLTVYRSSMFGVDYARVVGSFSLPISLGTFTVVTWALALQWGDLPRRLFRLVTVLAVLILVANVSATAWVAFMGSAASVFYFRIRLGWRIPLLVAALPLAIAAWSALPQLTGRYDIHDSLWGRIDPVHAYAQQHLSASQMLVGLGLGIGSNARHQLSGPASAANTYAMLPVGDSMPAVLFWQFGLVGLALAYWLMVLALQADAGARPIGIALMISSLTVNLTELFPVSLILGLWLARTARVATSDDHTD